MFSFEDFKPERQNSQITLRDCSEEASFCSKDQVVGTFKNYC